MSGGNVQTVNGEAQRHKQVIKAECAEVFHAAADHIRVIVKHLQDGLREELNEHKDDIAASDCNHGSHTAGLDGTVPLSGSDILGAHGGDGTSHGDSRHDGKSVEFANDPNGGRCIDPADRIDQGSDDQEGKAGDAVLDCSRKTDLDDQGHLLLMELKGGGFEVEDKVVLYHVADTEDHTERLGEHGSNGCAEGSHPESGNQGEIQNDIGNTGNEHEIKWTLTVAHPAHDGGEDIVTEDKDNSNDGYRQVAACFTERFCGGLDQNQNLIFKDQHHDGDDNT